MQADVNVFFLKSPEYSFLPWLLIMWEKIQHEPQQTNMLLQDTKFQTVHTQIP